MHTSRLPNGMEHVVYYLCGGKALLESGINIGDIASKRPRGQAKINAVNQTSNAVRGLLASLKILPVNPEMHRCLEASAALDMEGFTRGDCKCEGFVNFLGHLLAFLERYRMDLSSFGVVINTVYSALDELRHVMGSSLGVYGPTGGGKSSLTAALQACFLRLDAPCDGGRLDMATLVAIFGDEYAPIIVNNMRQLQDTFTAQQSKVRQILELEASAGLCMPVVHQDTIDQYPRATPRGNAGQSSNKIPIISTCGREPQVVFRMRNGDIHTLSTGGTTCLEILDQWQKLLDAVNCLGPYATSRLDERFSTVTFEMPDILTVIDMRGVCDSRGDPVQLPPANMVPCWVVLPHDDKRVSATGEALVRSHPGVRRCLFDAAAGVKTELPITIIFNLHTSFMGMVGGAFCQKLSSTPLGATLEGCKHHFLMAMLKETGLLHKKSIIDDNLSIKASTVAIPQLILLGHLMAMAESGKRVSPMALDAALQVRTSCM